MVCPEERLLWLKFQLHVVSIEFSSLNEYLIFKTVFPGLGAGNGTCPPCVIPPNDMCPQTTTPEPSDPPTFDRKLYLYRIEPNYVGIIGIISAKIREPTTSVNYSLDITNGKSSKIV